MSGSGSAQDRTSQRYAAARRVIDLLERFGAPPSPLSFELWLQYAANPGCAFALEVERLAAEGALFTDMLSEELASRFLPRHKLSQEIEETGEALARQLEAVGHAVDVAQGDARSYGRALAAGAAEFEQELDPARLRRLAVHLAEATHRVERGTAGLADLLSRSTHDVRRLREHMEQVRRESLTDALTNLPNRRAFEQALRKACEADVALGVALIDIDHFKVFNDTWGHQTGDQVLRYVASVLAWAGQPPRLAARYGGEEFAILFVGESELQAAGALEDLRQRIGSRGLKRRSTNEDLGSVTVSIGLALRRADEAMDGVIERADAAMYASKRGGRDRLTQASQMAGPSPALAADDLLVA